MFSNENENDNINSQFTDNTPNRSPFDPKDLEKIKHPSQNHAQLNKHKVLKTPQVSNEDNSNED